MVTLLVFIRWLKIYNHLVRHDKQHHREVVPAAHELSFERSNLRFSSTNSNVRTTLYTIINSTTGKHCSVAFIWMVTLKDFIQRLKSQNQLVYDNKQHHRKVLLSSIHLNDHTLGFHQSKDKTTLYSIINSTTRKYCSVAFIRMATR